MDGSKFAFEVCLIELSLFGDMFQFSDDKLAEKAEGDDIFPSFDVFHAYIQHEAPSLCHIWNRRAVNVLQQQIQRFECLLLQQLVKVVHIGTTNDVAGNRTLDVLLSMNDLEDVV